MQKLHCHWLFMYNKLHISLKLLYLKTSHYIGHDNPVPVDKHDSDLNFNNPPPPPQLVSCQYILLKLRMQAKVQLI